MARGVKPMMSSRLRGEGVDAGRHHKIREDFILGRQISTSKPPRLSTQTCYDI